MDTQLKELVIQLKLLGWEFPFVLNGKNYHILSDSKERNKGNYILLRRSMITGKELVAPQEYPELLEEVVEYINRRANEC